MWDRVTAQSAVLERIYPLRLLSILKTAKSGSRLQLRYRITGAKAETAPETGVTMEERAEDITENTL